MERGWPTTRQARRSDTPNCSRRATTARRRRSGVRSFPGSAPSACRLSKAWSATIFFRRWFSSRSSFSSLASSAFMPPYWFRQRCQVDSVISRWRATSSIVLPSPKELLSLGELADDLLGRVSASSSCCAVLLLPILGHRTRTTGGSVHGDPVEMRSAGADPSPGVSRGQRPDSRVRAATCIAPTGSEGGLSPGGGLRSATRMEGATLAVSSATCPGTPRRPWCPPQPCGRSSASSRGTCASTTCARGLLRDSGACQSPGPGRSTADGGRGPSLPPSSLTLPWVFMKERPNCS